MSLSGSTSYFRRNRQDELDDVFLADKQRLQQQTQQQLQQQQQQGGARGGNYGPPQRNAPGRMQDQDFGPRDFARGDQYNSGWKSTGDPRHDDARSANGVGDYQRNSEEDDSADERYRNGAARRNQHGSRREYGTDYEDDGYEYETSGSHQQRRTQQRDPNRQQQEQPGHSTATTRHRSNSIGNGRRAADYPPIDSVLEGRSLQQQQQHHHHHQNGLSNGRPASARSNGRSDGIRLDHEDDSPLVVSTRRPASALSASGNSNNNATTSQSKRHHHRRGHHRTAPQPDGFLLDPVADKDGDSDTEGRLETVEERCETVCSHVVDLNQKCKQLRTIVTDLETRFADQAIREATFADTWFYGRVIASNGADIYEIDPRNIPSTRKPSTTASSASATPNIVTVPRRTWLRVCNPQFVAPDINGNECVWFRACVIDTDTALQHVCWVKAADTKKRYLGEFSFIAHNTPDTVESDRHADHDAHTAKVSVKKSTAAAGTSTRTATVPTTSSSTNGKRLVGEKRRVKRHAKLASAPSGADISIISATTTTTGETGPSSSFNSKHKHSTENGNVDHDSDTIPQVPYTPTDGASHNKPKVA